MSSPPRGPGPSLGRRASSQQPVQITVRTPSRAKPAEPPSSSRRTPALPPSSARRLAIPGTHTAAARTPKTLTASARQSLGPAATPHARAVYRDLDTRRAAIFTPGRNRRRSLRNARATPRDALRALSRRLAPTTERPKVSSSPEEHGSMRGGSGELPEIWERDELDDDDDIPIDRPRLSLPIDVSDDDGDELLPHRSAGLEDRSNDGTGDLTARSVELPRRAVSELPRRFSRSSLASLRVSDYVTEVLDEFAQDGVGGEGFTGFFPSTFGSDDAPMEEVEYERLDSDLDRRATLGRESGFGPLTVPADANESTFFMAPGGESSPARPTDGIADVDMEVQAVDDDDEVFAFEDDAPVSEPDETAPPDIEESVMEAEALVASRSKRRRQGKKLSRHGIPYPSLPPGVVKGLAQGFAQSSGVGKAKISPETLKVIMQASDWFFEQLGDDLGSYAKHAGRKTIDESDVLMLMKRQRQTNATTTPFALAQRHLPRELLQEMRMPPPQPAKKPRKSRSGGDDGT